MEDFIEIDYRDILTPRCHFKITHDKRKDSFNRRKAKRSIIAWVKDSNAWFINYETGERFRYFKEYSIEFDSELGCFTSMAIKDKQWIGQ